MEAEAKTGMGRRQFIGAAAAAILAGAVIQITGCGSTDDEDPPAAGEGDAVGSIGSNHGSGQAHSAIITKATLDAGGALTLDIKGASSHSHTVQLSAQEVADIKAKTHVMKTSSTTNSHEHMVMFN